VVELLEEQGHEVVPMSRATGVDVISGEGLGDALVGVDCIIDAATGPSPDQDEATRFFETSARNLHKVGSALGVKRIVAVSIIGCDRFTTGYNAAKVVHERELLAGPIPVSIVRAAQFHEFVGELVGWGTQGDVCYMGRMRTQLVAARTVAESLVELAAASQFEPGAISEVAGPREESMVEAARLLVARRGDGITVEPVDMIGDPEGLSEQGAGLPGPDARLAGPTFEEWLGAEVPAA
jgi:hypothetical protein